MIASIVVYENGRPIINPTPEQLTTWALASHLESCGTCRNEACPTASHLQAAATPDRSWIPEPRTEA